MAMVKIAKIWRDILCKMAHVNHRRLRMGITGYNWLQIIAGLFRISPVLYVYYDLYIFLQSITIQSPLLVGGFSPPL